MLLSWRLLIRNATRQYPRESDSENERLNMMVGTCFDTDGATSRPSRLEVNTMTCTKMKILCASALAAFAMSAQADGAANFKADVNAAIDAGLTYARNNSYFTTENSANGLSLLTLLEKQSIPAGYNGLGASDQTLAQNAACILIASGNFGARGGFYAYSDGQVMMGLVVYLETGGPDEPTGSGGYNCVGKSARATINKVADRTLAAQTMGVPALNASPGYWGYSGNGQDSSTTQFALAGLAAAKSFYSQMGESGDKNRIPSLTTALNLTSDAYSVNGKASSGGIFDSCGVGGCSGHGYQSGYPAAYDSTQQTASGTWGQLVGTKGINNASVQRYLRWLQNTYDPTNNPGGAWYYGAYSYFYFLWSSSKAYNIIKDAGVAPAAGNIGPDNMGTLAPLTALGSLGGATSRVANRIPANDSQPAPRGSNGAGWYGNAPAGWYYDYSYRLMGLQAAGGQFSNPIGSWGYPAVDHSYAILVLQRSLGGICVDTDGDGVCDSVDNCPSVANPGQEKYAGYSSLGNACVNKCDANGDGKIDSTDIALIRAGIGKVANWPGQFGDPRDNNKDGVINIVDVRACTLKCTNANCAP